MESLEDRRLLAVIGYDESIGGDLDNSGSSSFLLDDVGTHVWNGTMETPADPIDTFEIRLASGIRVDAIRLDYIDVDLGTDPDSNVRVQSTAGIDHTFIGSQSVADGSFSDANPTLPEINATYSDVAYTVITLSADLASPAGNWTIEIDTTLADLAPEIQSSTAIAVNENSSSVVDIQSIDDVDSEGSGLTYAIVGGADALDFNLDTATGQLDFSSPPNFESAADADQDNTYVIDVSVTDTDGLMSTQTLLVEVLDINETPVADAGGPYAIDAGQALMLDASGTNDPDAGETLSYQWDFNGDAAADFVTANPIETVPWLDFVDVINLNAPTVSLTVVDADGLSSNSSASLTISDHFFYSPLSDGNADFYTLSRDATDLRITETNGVTLLSKVPLSFATTINLFGGSDVDTLTVDFSGGAIQQPIEFLGGDPTTEPGDALQLTGGVVQSVHHTLVNESAGSVLIVFSGTESSSIQYGELEPVIDNLSAADRVFTFTGADETIVLSNGPELADNMNRIDSTLGERIDFVNPTNSLTINADLGIDTVELASFDDLTVFNTLSVNTGAEADSVSINAIPLNITTLVDGGLGNDQFFLASGSLDGVLGDVSFTGGGGDVLPTQTESVTAKGNMVSATVASGDTLTIDDSATPDDRSYTLTDTQLTRTGLASSFSFGTIETLMVLTGTGNDLIDIQDTPDTSSVSVTSGNGLDEVTIHATGIGSILALSTGADSGQIDVLDTGENSVTLITTGAAADIVSITNTGDSSGVSVDVLAGDDIVDVIDSGDSSVIRLSLGADNDTTTVLANGANSFLDAFGDEGTDSFFIGANGAGDLSTILGDICVFGGADPVAGGAFDVSVTAKGNTVTQTAGDGDVLLINDAATATDETHTLSDVDFVRSAMSGTITYETIENLQLRTGLGADDVTVTATPNQSRLFVSTAAGNDSVDVHDTGDQSILIVETLDGLDTVNIVDTGVESVSVISTGEADDEVEVQSTGDRAGLRVDTELGNDQVDLLGTGIDSVTRLGLDEGDDISTVQGTGLGSVTDLFAGDGIDTINISSSPAATLDEILGDICVLGEAPTVAGGLDASVTAKALTITQSIDRGDVLNISDAGSIADNTYLLSDTTFARIGLSGAITYQTIETLNIETGSGNDQIDVSDSADATRLTLDTGVGNDIVNVVTTGDASIFELFTVLGNDTVTIQTTGAGSVSLIETGADNDTVTVSSGNAAGVSVDSGVGADEVSLVSSGDDSATLLTLGDGDDTGSIQATGLGSATVLFAGAGLDEITLSSATNTLDGILGDVCVFGELPTAQPGIDASVTAKTITVTQSVDRGDILNVIDAGSAASHSYTLNADTFARTGLPGTIQYETIETLNIETGSSSDSVSVLTTAVGTRLTLATGAGNDAVSISSTGSASIMQLASADGDDTVSIATTGNNSVFVASTGAGSDTINIDDTGDGSGVSFDAGTGADLVNVLATGDVSAVSLTLGASDDISNIRATGLGSATDVFAGDGLDTINITSDPTPTLDGILGDICVFGEDGLGAVSNASVSAQQTIGDVETNTANVQLGDQLFVSDAGTLTDQSYLVDSSSITRVGNGRITYETVELVSLATSQANDTVAVASTADATEFRLDTGSGDDGVSITTVGADSITRITTDTGMDNMTIDQTGDRSVVLVDAGADNDSVTISSIGTQSGIGVLLQIGNDTLNLAEETIAAGRTGTSVIQASGGAGDDVFDVDEIYLSTTVELAGDADTDEFLLTADGADAAGYLGRINNDPAGVSDPVAATRQLFLDGGSNPAGVEVVTEGVIVLPTDMADEGTVNGVASGDRVEIDASSASNALDLRYVITGAARGVLATTQPVVAGGTRATDGNEVFETLGVESVQIQTGSADDLLTLSSEVPFGVLSTEHLITLDAGAGQDKFEVVGTSGDDLITVGDEGGDLQPIELNDVERVRIDGNDGDDQISTQTNTLGTLNGNDGNDSIIGGIGQDLLTGGAGVDNLFGNDGNDVLLSDQEFGIDDPFIEANEVLNGGSETDLDPGDVCVQFGFDSVNNCEVLGDGGGTKDVLTWIRAILIPLDAISFGGSDEFLAPFEPVSQTPVAGLAVSEPSQIPRAASTLTIGSTGSPEFEMGDVNRDGQVSLLDALVVINHMSRQQASGESAGDERSAMDVNEDGTVGVLDALIVINELARKQGSSGEGELASDWVGSVDHYFAADDDDDQDQLISELF